MKILLIMAGKGKGGLENHFLELSHALSERHDIHVVADSEFVDSFSKASNPIKFYALDMNRSRRNIFLLYAIAKIIRDVSPDIVHSQANKAVAIIARIKPFIADDIKLIGTLHNIKKNLKIYKCLDFVIGVSSRVIEKLDNPNKVVIYNGVKINPDRIQSRNYLLTQLGIDGRDKDTKLLVSIGRLVPAKRFDILIKAVQSVPNVHLVIVGDGKERGSLEQLVETYASDNITFMGHRKDNIEILSAADLCVISSEREGFSYVMAESLLLGTPVISTDVADLKEILPPGTVVQTNDAEALNKLLLDALDNLELFSQRYQATFAWANENFGFDSMVRKHEDVYKKVLGIGET